VLLALSEPVSLRAVLPELVLATAGCVALVCGQARQRAVRDAIPWITLLGVIAAGLLLRLVATETTSEIHSGLLLDNLALFIRLNTIILGVVIVLVAWEQPTEAERGEFFSMLAFTLAGLMLVGAAANLLVLFMALELVSIPAYVLVTLSRRDPRAIESGTKYFYLGALAAAITAYGFSFLYGVTGSATLDDEAVTRLGGDALSSPGTLQHALATAGVVLSVAGLLFKMSAVPLHFYVADVYQGAASSVAGMLGFVPKMAGLVAILKIASLTGWQTLSGGLFWLLWLVSVASMTLGNVLALRQTNIKRMLAFSGVAHAGYMLIGVLAGPAAGSMMGDGTAAALFYMVIYGIANLGAFALLGILRVRGEACETLQDVAGLVRRHPGLALLMALAMLALLGLPPTTGFWGKVGLFGSGLAVANQVGQPTRSWMIALVIIAGINSAIGAAYYLRATAAVLLYERAEPATPRPEAGPYMGALMAGFLTLILTIVPGLLMRAGYDATRELREGYAVRPASDWRSDEASAARAAADRLPTPAGRDRTGCRTEVQYTSISAVSTRFAG